MVVLVCIIFIFLCFMFFVFFVFFMGQGQYVGVVDVFIYFVVVVLFDVDFEYVFGFFGFEVCFQFVQYVFFVDFVVFIGVQFGMDVCGQGYVFQQFLVEQYFVFGWFGFYVGFVEWGDDDVVVFDGGQLQQGKCFVCGQQIVVGYVGFFCQVWEVGVVVEWCFDQQVENGFYLVDFGIGQVVGKLFGCGLYVYMYVYMFW